MKLKKVLFKLLPERSQKMIKDYYRIKRSKQRYNPDQYLTPKYESSLAAFDYYECIFVHIPKNAGLSVSYTLFGNTGGSHRKIRDYQQLYAAATFKRYFKFAFVRNPWDRVVSTYFFLKKGGITEKDRLWADTNVQPYSDFKDFIRSWLTEENINQSLHFQSQMDFLIDSSGNIGVDFIGRFETLEEDFQFVTEKLGIRRELNKTNSSERESSYRHYYDEGTKRIVEEVYKKDIEHFQYTF